MGDPAPAGPDDDVLIARIQAGDQTAFRVLVDRYKAYVFDLGLRLLGNEADAEDAAQDAFLRVFRSIDAYRPGGKASNWIYTIALNVCRNALRKRRVLRMVSFGLLGGPDPDAEIEFPDRAPTPEKIVEDREAERIFQGLVDALPATLREAFVLRYRFEKSDEEIAAILGASVNHVRVKISRAKDRLKGVIEGGEPGIDREEK